MAAALEGASVAVFGCNHSEFRSADVVGLINENVQQPGLIIDGRKAIRHRLNGSEGQLLSNLEFRSV
jgi:hypothetical protein